MTRAVYTPRLSQHAYEQYCKRVAPADWETVRAHILEGEAGVWVSWGVHAIYGYRGLNIYAKGGVVTTVTPDTWERSRSYVGLDKPIRQGRRGRGRRPDPATKIEAAE